MVGLAMGVIAFVLEKAVMRSVRKGGGSTDDGRGFDPSASRNGTGLQGIADRLGALEGRFDVTSSPGRGTTLEGSLPAVALATVSA